MKNLHLVLALLVSSLFVTTVTAQEESESVTHLLKKKTKKMYSYDAETKTYTLDGTRVELFGKKGNLIEMRYEYDRGSSFNEKRIYEYRYNSDDNLIKKVKRPANSENGRATTWTFKYDDQNRQVEMLVQVSEGCLIFSSEKTITKYHENGKVSLRSLYSDGTLFEKQTFNDDGSPAEQRLYRRGENDSVLENKTTWKYRDGKLREVVIESGGLEWAKSIYKYPDNKTKEITVTWRGILFTKYVLQYNNEGTLLKEVIYMVGGREDEWVLAEQKLYHESGSMKRWASYNNVGTLRREITYAYDRRGNLITVDTRWRVWDAHPLIPRYRETYEYEFYESE